MKSIGKDNSTARKKIEEIQRIRWKREVEKLVFFCGAHTESYVLAASMISI